MREKLLVVDDDRLQVEMLADILRADFDVLTAYDGDQGIEKLEEEPVCAVLCDQNMPTVQGVEVLKRCIDLRPDAVRILVTATEKLEDLRDAVNNARVHRVLVKPVREVEVRSAVQGALREQRLERENARLVKELKAALVELQDHEKELEHELQLRTKELKDVMDRILEKKRD